MPGIWGLLLGGLAACAAAPGSDPAQSDAAAPPDSGVAARSDSGRPDGGGPPAAPLFDPWPCGPSLGARLDATGELEVRVHAPRATHVEVALFDAAFGAGERLRAPLEAVTGGGFRGVIAPAVLSEAGLDAGPLYYGLRVWGPNWVYDPDWSPGSEAGRIGDVDAAGNRMNPNKLLLDPYALEVSHDPIHAEHRDYGVYRTDEGNRSRDSGPFAPKGVVVQCEPAESGPTRAFRDEVVYEVHLRGLTRSDPSVPESERGTYAGAARKAVWLRALGVTAIELLPLHETPNDQNELSGDAQGDNYWGYSSLSFFAPDRRYALDKAAGGPTRELAAMVRAFHEQGLKVYVDVVFNHTAEGGAHGDAASLLSLRGLDNASFYELSDDSQGYVVSNGVGPNVNTAEPLAAELVLASLRYWHEVLGVDGFRFDLASVVANGCSRGCYRFDPGFPARIAEELGRAAEGGAGVDLIAESWGAVGEAYQVGNFPAGWAEWNDRYRDALRRDLNRVGQEAVPVRELIGRIAGSADLFEDDARPPASSLNYIVAHDGLTLHDLFRHDGKHNDRDWPFGPSDGGTDSDLASRHLDDPVRQATATRTSLALLAVSAGVPMITGGDEAGRTLRGNNNPYNLDNEANWLKWPGDPAYDEALRGFVSRLFAFRAAHAALRPKAFWQVFGDADGDGLTEVRWFRDDGIFVDDGYLDAADRHLVAWQLDGDELGDDAATLFFAYNGWTELVPVTLPEPPGGLAWHRVIDTGDGGAAFGWVDPAGGRVEQRYPVEPLSLVALVAR